MKITRLRTQVVRLPIDPPILSGLGGLTEDACVLCFLETDQPGLVGEALIHAINGTRIGVLDAMVQSLAPLVEGIDLDQARTVNARLWQEFNFLAPEGTTIQALSAVDNALWDARAKHAGLNVAQLVGACHAAVPVYASGGLWLSTGIDALQREAAGYAAQGFCAMKMRVGPGSPRDSVARVRAVREAIGPEIGLMVDANQQLDVKEAIRLGRLLAEFDLAWFEEPIPFHDHAGEARIRAALDTPIASGETVHTHRGVLAMLQAGAADILMPDLQRMGGATEFLKAGTLCEAFGIPIASHLFTEMSLPLLATMPNAAYLEHMPWFEPLYGETLRLDGKGRAIVPGAPGWGAAFDPAAIRRFSVS